MRKCPYCQAEIEENARFCLYCMRPLNEKTTAPLLKKRRPWWLLLVAGVLLVALTVVLLLPRGQDTPNGQLLQVSESTGASVTSQPVTDTTGANVEQIPDTTETADSQPKQEETSPNAPPSTRPAMPDKPGTSVPTTAPATPTTPPTTAPTVVPTTAPTTIPTTPHTHSYTVKNTSESYLISEARCDRPATYVYSCACGAAGTETFQWGEVSEHIIAVDQGYPGTCDSWGVTDGIYCSTCGMIFQDHTEIAPLGHLFSVEDPDSGCARCSAQSPVTIKHPTIPHFFSDQCAISDGKYTLSSSGKNHKIIFTFGYINHNSESISAVVGLYGASQSDCSYETRALTDKRGTFTVSFSIPKTGGTYTLTFEKKEQ